MMNLADPELELVDPTPNVHMLFVHFDREFFCAKLASRAVVRWSKRMYSCAGICSYEGRGGLCDIALSEPLLKLRPRKDLIETLLHEMIHAYLFVTNRDQDRDGHGPNFQAHMHRINKSAGLNISIYHSFHDEVHLYQTHWWRCNGPCVKVRPHFGIVRRSMNRAPGPSDYWWNDHQRKCGGTFIKIKEPENYKAKQKATGKTNSENTKKNINNKSNGDITKYINNNIKTIDNISNKNVIGKPVLKDSNIISSNKTVKPNGSSTFVVTKKGVTFNPTAPKPQLQVPMFSGNGNTINQNKHISDHRNVTETVRNIWANKEIPMVINKAPIKKLETSILSKKPSKSAGNSNASKQKAIDSNGQSPPAKMKKIDDYFKSTATSMLKDLYGEEFKLTQNHNSTKIIAVPIKIDLVDCPTCNAKIDSNKINEHLDECLNKEIISQLCEDEQLTEDATPSGSNISNNNLVQKVVNIPPFKGNIEQSSNIVDLTCLNNIDNRDNTTTDKDRRKSDSHTISKLLEQKVGIESSQITNVNKPNLNKLRKSDNFIAKDNNKVSNSKSETDPEKSSNVKDRSKPALNKFESEPSTSKHIELLEQVCPCCGIKFDKTFDEHLDECLVFSQNNNNTKSQQASTSSNNNNNSAIVIDEDDMFDESQEFNATGTKTPCPCCMEMVEEVDMNDHLDLCLGIAQS